MEVKDIRNFSIIAHIDHGKSTLADRMLELTGTIEKRKMKEQVLDQMDLERERGITIKMQPVRMVYHSHRGITQNDMQNNAEFLYKDLTYQIRGAIFQVRKKLGLGHKEQVYHNALVIEFKKAGLIFESKKNISIWYEGKHIGIYQPDFVVDGKVLVEIKALPEIGRSQIEQLWTYLKGCDYKLALLVNFGSKDLEIKRVVYDTARQNIIPRNSALSQRDSAQVEYILNLIDTPGHIDFTYEVSRALKAVEGAVLLVDATQGVQAQTIANVEMAKSLGLVIIPVINKIDLPSARIKETKEEIRRLFGGHSVSTRTPSVQEILEVSAKTGEGVENLLKVIIERIPAPRLEYGDRQRALIFDFEYSNHQGVIVYVRMMDGSIKKGDDLVLSQVKEKFIAGEVGIFSPKRQPKDSLDAGEIGYIVTNIKKPTLTTVGDSVVSLQNSLPSLSGYMQPQPVVWASIYPQSQDDFDNLRQSLERLRLSDSSITFEEESSGALGRGFRCGFLGMLHLEIITERLKREFNLNLVVASPTITYRIVFNDGKERNIYSPLYFPDEHLIKKIFEPWVQMQIITPPDKLGQIMQILHEYETEVGETEQFGDSRTILNVKMPLRELMRDFFDRLKSVSAGYASLNYKIEGMREVKPGHIVRLDVLVAEELVPAFSRIISKDRVERESEEIVEKLKKILPRALFVVKIQAKALGRIIASRSLSALKKDVTGYLYGGDRTRKMKLWKKQKRGKEKLKKIGKVNIPHDVFIKMIQR